MTAFTLLVVLHDSAPELRALLDSIDRHLDPRPPLVVVDSGSRDDGAHLARDRGAELVVLDANRGFGPANNAGLERVTTPVTVLLNPDVELRDDGLARLAAVARARRVLAVPRLLNADRSPQRSAHPLPGRARELLPALVHPRALPGPLRRAADPWRSDRPRRVGWAVAACLAARTDILVSLGPFDPGQFLFYEDMDLCLRAGDAGVPTELHPEIAVVHTGGHSTAPAYGGEPHALLARRRHEVVAARLGGRAAAMDDLAQATTFATRALGRRLLGRDSRRERAQLAAVLEARRGST